MITKTVALLLAAAAMFACAPAQDDVSWAVPGAASTSKAWEPKVTTNFRGTIAYKNNLIAAIERADRIVLVEHSTQFDYAGKETGESDQLPPVVYGTVRLSAAQRETFVASVRQIPAESANWGLACTFDAHHSFFFFSKKALTSRMDVCFHCGEVRWDGSHQSPPLHLTDGLAEVVKSAGLSPEREWGKVLAAARAKGNAK